MAASAPYRWLAANAARFGFEQSFPAGNAQGVKWEPWHWRWVGTAPSVAGAARARFVKVVPLEYERVLAASREAAARAASAVAAE